MFLTNDIHNLAPVKAIPLMCNAHGGVIDDLYAYSLSAEV